MNWQKLIQMPSRRLELHVEHLDPYLIDGISLFFNNILALPLEHPHITR